MSEEMQEAKKMTADVRKYLCKRLDTIAANKLALCKPEQLNDQQRIKDVPELAKAIKEAKIPTAAEIRKALQEDLTVGDCEYGISSIMDELFADALGSNLDRIRTRLQNQLDRTLAARKLKIDNAAQGIKDKIMLGSEYKELLHDLTVFEQMEF